MIIYQDFLNVIKNIDDDIKFEEALQNARTHNNRVFNDESNEFLILCDLSNTHTFNELKQNFSKEHLNNVFYKIFNGIDFSTIHLSDENLRNNLLDGLINIYINDFFNEDNQKLIENNIFNNLNFYLYSDRFIIARSSYNKQDEVLNYITKTDNPLFIKHYLWLLFNYPDRHFIHFIKNSSLDFFKEFSTLIFKGAVYQNELDTDFKSLNIENIIHRYDEERYKGKKANEFIFELCFYETYLFYSLLDLCEHKDEQNILQKIQFLIDNDFIDINIILKQWNSLQENLTLFSNINQAIEKYQRHPFLKLVKKGFHHIALYFLQIGYTLSKEENSYILNSNKKNKQIYKDFTFELKNGFYDEFKYNIDKCDSSQNSFKKIETIFNDETNRKEIFDILIHEDEISFKKITPELVNISKSEISKYNFLSTVDILIISMNTTAVELLFKNNYPFNIKQMLLFCRFSRKHYDKYRGVISYLSNFLLNRNEHYNYFMSHNLNISREDGLQINEKYVRELTGNYNFMLNKGLGLSAINKLSHHLRFKETKYEYYRSPLNLNLYSYFLNQDYHEINTYYDLSLISFLVIQKADEGHDVSSLFNVLEEHGAENEIQDIVKFIKEEKNLSDAMIHFLSLNDKRNINKIIEEPYKESKRKRI